MRSVLVLALLAGCGATTPRAEPATARPCGDEAGLVIEAPAAIAARREGAVLLGGRGHVTLRWCGHENVRLASVRVTHGGAEQLLWFDDVTLASGDTFEAEIDGTASPSTLTVEATVLAADGRPIVTTTFVESVEDPALVADRDECIAAGGTFGPVGLAGALACNRPTSDAGTRCLSEGDCEGACLDDHTEVVGAAPDGRTCGAGEELRLHVGTCAPTTLLFGCSPRLLEVTTECVRPGMATRSHTVCVD